MPRTAKTLPPLHPGEILREEFMEPLNLTAYALAKACHVPRTRIERIAREEIGITADTALRLARYFKTTPQFWLNLQSDYDLRTAQRELAKTLQKIEPRELEDALLYGGARPPTHAALLLRLGREGEGMAFAAAEIGRLLGLAVVPGEHGDHLRRRAGAP